MPNSVKSTVHETTPPLGILFSSSNLLVKACAIIGSIYPEKLVFDGFHYRTARLNEAVELIYSMGKGFSENENGQTEVNFDLPV